MKYIVVDLEMNYLPRKYKEERKICKTEIIQIGAVCLDEDYKEIDHFMTYVCPSVNPLVEKQVTELTHITTQMIQGAPRFKEAIRMFFKWCRGFGNVQLFQWSESDYIQVKKEMVLSGYVPLPEEYVFMNEPWNDLQDEYDKKIGKIRKTSLSQALMLMGYDFQGIQHDALHDTRNEAEILRIIRNQDECQKLLGNVMNALRDTPFAFTIADAVDLNAFKLSA